MSDNGTITMGDVEAIAAQLPTRTTDPATRREWALQILRNAATPADPVHIEAPAPVVQLEQAPPRPKVFPPVRSRMVRAWAWLGTWYGTAFVHSEPGGVIVPNGLFQALWAVAFRVGVGFHAAPVKAWGFLTVVTSKPVTPEVYRARMVACGECPARHYRMRRAAGVVLLDEHCGLCGCPDWWLSRNKNRNKFAGWKCPARKHDGEYPGDDLRKALEKKGYDPETTEKILAGGGGGCTGCGCGKAPAK